MATRYVGDNEKIILHQETSFGVVAANNSVITGISKANPGVISDVAHGYVDDDIVQITGVVGMIEINGIVGKVAKIDADSYTLGIDTTNFSTYVSGGVGREIVFASLSHDEQYFVVKRCDVEVDPNIEPIKGMSGSIKANNTIEKLSRVSFKMTAEVVDPRGIQTIISNSMTAAAGTISALTPTATLQSYTAFIQVEVGHYICVTGIKMQGRITGAREGAIILEADGVAQDVFVIDGTLTNTLPTLAPLQWYDSSTITLATNDILVQDFSLSIDRGLEGVRDMQTNAGRKRIITEIIEKGLSLDLDLTISVQTNDETNVLQKVLGANYIADALTALDAVLEFTAEATRVLKMALDDFKFSGSYEGSEEVDQRTYRLRGLGEDISFANSKYPT